MLTAKQWIWIFGTTSNLKLPIFLQPYGVHLQYFKLRLLDLTGSKVGNINGLSL